MSEQQVPPPENSTQIKHYGRNFAALVGDYVAFGVGAAFLGWTTVLPDFVNRLTSSKVLVGMILTVGDGAWLLPQLLFANLMLNKARKKPYVTVAGILGRPAWLFYALALGLGLYRYPALAVGLLFLTLFLFLGSDSLAAVAWFDIMAKAVPPERRGRLVGISQVVQYTLSIGAGLVVAGLLSVGGPPFPQNYMAIFAIAGLILLLSLVSWLFVVEPEEPVAQTRMVWRNYLRQLLRTLRADKVLRRVITVRLLAGVEVLAAGFYIGFAREKLGLPESMVGIFTSVQTVGGILGSIGLGVLSERVGNHRVIQIATAVAALAPLVGLVFALAGFSGGVATPVLFALVFLVMGITGSAYVLGFVNYVIELGTAPQRPVYIGLFNTISGVLVVLPVLGGWLLQTTSYGVIFGLTLGAIIGGAALSWRLPRGRGVVHGEGAQV